MTHSYTFSVRHGSSVDTYLPAKGTWGYLPEVGDACVVTKVTALLFVYATLQAGGQIQVEAEDHAWGMAYASYIKLSADLCAAEHHKGFTPAADAEALRPQLAILRDVLAGRLKAVTIVR